MTFPLTTTPGFSGWTLMPIPLDLRTSLPVMRSPSTDPAVALRATAMPVATVGAWPMSSMTLSTTEARREIPATCPGGWNRMAMPLVRWMRLARTAMSALPP